MENNHIIATFLQACRNPLFQHRWMAAETWSELINDHYRIAPSLRFSGESLLKAVSRCKWLNNLVNTGVINDSISLFRNNYRPKGSKNCYCFYAAPKGVTASWYLNISKELLSTKVTRSCSLTFDFKLPNENLTTTGRVPKRKRPQTDITKDSSSFKLLPKLEQSSSDLLPSSSAIEMRLLSLMQVLLPSYH